MKSTLQEPALSLAQLDKKRKVDVQKITRISHAQLTSNASKLANKAITLPLTALMELTARHPYDAAGLMDVYKPGRWDCTSNLLFMDTIVATGPFPGEWDGSVVYANFKPSTPGTYLIVATFTGYQITMNLYGPWGTNTAYTPTTSDTGTAIALWTAAPGDSLYFDLNCTSPGGEASIGYLESLQVFAL
jgi:hypothetical protein